MTTTPSVFPSRIPSAAFLLAALFAVLMVPACGGSKKKKDTTPPGPVTGLTSVFDPVLHQINLAWTNPADADFAGVLIARALGAPVAGSPVNGTTYLVGSALPGGGTVVAVGNMTTFFETAPPAPAQVHYRVFSFDTSNNYAAGVPTSVAVPAPVLTGTLSVALGSGAVTVLTQPVFLNLSGSAVYNPVGMTLDVDLVVRNDYPRLLFNLKTIVDATNEGSVTGDGTFAGDPYVYYGPHAHLPGATVSRTITVNGVTGLQDPITLDLTFRDHEMLLVPQRSGGNPVAVDVSGTGQEHVIDTGTVSFLGSGSTGGVFPGAWSPDGRYVYLGSRNQPCMVMIDTFTLLPAVTLDLSGANNIQFDATGSVGFVGEVVMSPNAQFLYVSLTLGGHALSHRGGGITGYGGPSLSGPTDGFVVKLDRATLMEVSRVTLFTGDVNESNVRGLDLSPDGSMVACGAQQRGEVYVIDTATMTILDADSVAPGIQPFDVSGHSLRPRYTAFGPTGTEVFVAHAGGTDDTTLDVIDLGTLSIGTLPPPASFAGYSYNEIGALATGPDGRLYYAHPYNASFPGLTVFDHATMTWDEFLAAPDYVSVNALTFSADGTRYFVYHNAGGIPDFVRVYDVATDLEIPFEASGATTLNISLNGWGHTLLVSPF